MRAFAVRREQIEQGERNVTRVCRGGADGALARLLGRACLRRAQREVAQRAQPTLAEHASRGLGSGGEDAMHTARLVPDGAERQGEVALLAIPMSVERKEKVVGEGRLAPHGRASSRRPSNVPDSGPALTPGPP